MRRHQLARDRALTWQFCQVKLTILPGTYEDVRPYVPGARGEGLLFKPEGTDYYIARLDGVVCGFCGVRWHGRSCTFKNDYVLPEYRGRGVHDEMMRYRMRLAYERGVSVVRATCTQDSIRTYVRLGGTIRRVRQCGTYDIELKIQG